MDGEYPIKPYKEPKKTGVLTTTITGKMGKAIEVVYQEATPEVITFNIKSNRGTLKDVIEIPKDEFVHLVGIADFWDRKQANKKE